MKPFRLFILIQFFAFVVFVLYPQNVLAQKKFTVICDKTDNQVKVVEATNRSPNYVPIKGGFPFRQVAQKWIDENYSTIDCNPNDVIKKQNQTANTNKTPLSTNQVQQNNAPSSSTSPVNAQAGDANSFNNTSIYTYVKLSDLGKAFFLENGASPGVSLGIEQLIGKSMYLGIGLATDFYFLNLSSTYDNLDSKLLFMGKIPLFLGFRNFNGKTLFMSEFGVTANSSLVALSDEMDIPGRTFKSSSYNLLGRVKVGNDTALFEIGSEYWLTNLFENYDFKMKSIYIGFRFYF